MASNTHVSAVRCLYKRILLLHRSLPLELKALGDEYVKAEFRRHKSVKQDEALRFMIEWKNYADTVSQQIAASLNTAEQDAINVGDHIDGTVLDSFNEQQLGQLYELGKETSKPHLPPNQS